MYTYFNPFSLLQPENYGAQKLKLFQPPHLYYLATLPSETNTDAVSMSLLRYYCVYV